MQQAGQGLSEQGFAAACGANQEDVAFGQFYVAVGLGRVVFCALALYAKDALVMVVDRHRQHFFGAFLTNHILVEIGDNLFRAGNRTRRRRRSFRRFDAPSQAFFGQNFCAQKDALVTDINIIWTFDQALNFSFFFAAKRTAGRFRLKHIGHRTKNPLTVGQMRSDK